MENKEMQELLKKLKAAKSAQELIEMAKAQGTEIAADMAEELFTMLNAEEELSDEDMEKIAGGDEVPEPMYDLVRLDGLDGIWYVIKRK